MESSSFALRPPLTKRLKLSLTRRRASPVKPACQKEISSTQIPSENDVTDSNAASNSSAEKPTPSADNSPEENTPPTASARVEAAPTADVAELGDKPKAVCGVRNVGNTCYLAVVIQLIRCLPDVSDKIRKMANLAAMAQIPTSSSVDLLLAMDTMLTVMAERELAKSSSSGAVSAAPDDVLAVLRRANCLFSGGGQQDAHECLQSVLEHLDNAGQAVTRRSAGTAQAAGSAATTTGTPARSASPHAGSVLGSVVTNGVALPATSSSAPPPSPQTEACTTTGNSDCPSPLQSAAPRSSRALSDCPLTKPCAPVMAADEPTAAGSALKTAGQTTTGLVCTAADSGTTLVDSSSSIGSGGCSERAPEPSIALTPSPARPDGGNTFAELAVPTKPPAARSRVRKASVDELTCLRSSKRLRLSSSSSVNDENGHFSVNTSAGHTLKEQAMDTDSGKAPVRFHMAPSATSAQSQQDECNIISSSFQGEMATCTKCFECESLQQRRETFTDLSVPVCKEATLRRQATRSIMSNVNVVSHSLPWCLAQLMHPSAGLSGANKYSCGSCCRSTEARIWYSFTTLPRMLLVQLKRFTTVHYGSSMSAVKKIHGNIATPIEMSLASWCQDSCCNRDQTYRLHAVIMHSGAHSNTGHYTIYCRAQDRPGDSLPSVSSTSAGQKTAAVGDQQSAAYTLTGSGAASVTAVMLQSEVPTGSSARDPPLDTSQQVATVSDSAAAPALHQVNGCSAASTDSNNDQSSTTGAESQPRWVYFDDATARYVSEDDLIIAMSPLDSGSKQSLTPYILCYVRT